jgi:predicted O-methyltransferase YrrM
MHHAVKRLQHLEAKLLSRQARFAIPFSYRGMGHFKLIEPRQNSIEIESLYRLICDLEPHRVLEVGTARGGTLYLWTQAAANDATLVSVDLPGGDFGGAYPSCRIPFYQTFARAGQSLHLLRVDSHQPDTLSEVSRLFQNRQIDFAFLDGDHSYAGVKADFEMYGPLVRPGGIIAFHDILHREEEPDIRVDRLWRELRETYDTEEFIGPDGSGRKIGIGIVRVHASGVESIP